jgi:trimethylamine--corrinoid protein Co-methyltransferase
MSVSRRRRRREKNNDSPFFQIPFREIRNPWPPLEIITPEQIALIDAASLTILEEVGMRFLDAEALALWDKAGAKVDHAAQRVWLERGLVRELIAHAPSFFTMRARNPARHRFVGENAINFFPAGGMVNFSSLKTGRRPGTKADVITLQKLIQQSNVLHVAGIQVVAMHDLPVSERHLHSQLLGYTLTDKAMWGVSHGRVIANDCLEMARLVFGDDLVTGGTVTGGVINVNSPLVLDERMLGGMITYAQAGQPNIITPFILAGAMSPVSMPAAIAQQNAEVLAAVALTQLVRPGAPVLYGGFTTNVDMQSGSPAFGTPEGAWAFLIGTQLARYYGLPYRGSGSLNTANVPDAQAAYETQWTLWPVVMAHANLVVHAAGWLESGLTVSLEKFIIDVEGLAMMQYFLAGIDITPASLALDMIKEVGPGGHHFCTSHTQENLRTAFYRPFLSDRRSYGTWEGAGRLDTVQRAALLGEHLINRYEAPPLDEAIRDSLEAFVARRSHELTGVDLYG